MKEKKMSNAKKLQAIADIVATARDSYGNKKAGVAAPEMNTSHGSMPFNELGDDSKLAYIAQEVVALKAAVLEVCRNDKALNPKKKMEEAVATSPLLCNVTGGTVFDYL